MKKTSLKLLVLVSLLLCLIAFATSCEELLGSGGAQEKCKTHTFGVWSQNTATCEKNGYMTRTCSVCSYVEVETTYALGHDLQTHPKKAATCDEAGYEAYKSCKRCSYQTEKKVISKLSHNYIEYELKAATCTEPGHPEYKECSLCGIGNYREIEPKGHNFGEWKNTAGSCIEGAVESRSCSRCGETETRAAEASGHVLGGLSENTATCTAPGTAKKYCVRCDYYEMVQTEAKGHTLGDWMDNTATCESAGTMKKYCSDCSYFEEKEIAPIGHKLGNWRGNTATCTEGGQEFRYCSVTGCIKSESRDTEALGHSNVNSICQRCRYTSLLIMVFESKAEFKVVYTAESSANKRIADELVDFLRSYGVSIADPISDENPAYVSEREIIIGTGAKNRGDTLKIDSRYLGLDGYTIRTVGERIVIAGGCDEMTEAAFLKYKSEAMTPGSESFAYLGVPNDYNVEKLTEYPIKSITVAGNDIRDYSIVIDVASGYKTNYMKAFRENLYSVSGYWLKVGTSQSSYTNSIVIRTVEDTGDKFVCFVNGSNLIIECEYGSVFDEMFTEFIDEYLLNKSGALSFGVGFRYEKDVKVITYEEYGAKGDGVTCDFTAIYNAHVAANQSGLKVVGKPGAVYKISAANFTKTIPIKTDTDFCGATFVIDDVGDKAYANRSKKLFTVEHDYSLKFTDSDGNGVVDDSRFSGVEITYGQTKFGWLEGVLEREQSIVRVISSKHKDFIRHGSNQSNGENRQDVFIVDKNGNVSSDTPVVFEFTGDIDITEIRIFSADDRPITVQNGKFVNICCRTVSATNYKSKYTSYYRGFELRRSNTTVKNITHEMQDEPKFGYIPAGSGYSSSGDSKYAKYGSRCESYPYYGFFYILETYNLDIVDCTITGHTTYYEDKTATETSNTQDPVAMGSYDFVIDRSVNVTFKNVIQSTSTRLDDQSIWGIMSSNGTKNMTFDGCQINRFDAHRGFYNGKIINSTIGHSINLVGGGLFHIENTTKIGGPNFIYLRGDYGATFDGDIIIKDCTFKSYAQYYTNRNQSVSTSRNSNSYIINAGFSGSNSGWSEANPGAGYWLWDFGYTCYMPRNVVIDKFTCESTNTYVFNNLPDAVFTANPGTSKNSVTNVYQLTESVTFKGMGNKNIPICQGNKNIYTKLHSIKIIKQ